MEYKSILHRFPAFSLAQVPSSSSAVSKLKDIKGGILHFITNLKIAEGIAAFSSSVTRINLRPPNFSLKRILKAAAIALALLALVFGIYKLIRAFANLSQGPSKIQVKAATASQELNKEFSFSLKDSNGDEVSKLKFLIERVEFRNEIIVKGQRANMIKGRTFLIVNLKITNEFTKPIQIDTRDYLRLSVNGKEEEWLAPDVHNDPVEVQAISTKYTRVGFPINTSDTKLVLRVGEINGDKEKINLSLK